MILKKRYLTAKHIKSSKLHVYKDMQDIAYISKPTCFALICNMLAGNIGNNSCADELNWGIKCQCGALIECPSMSLLENNKNVNFWKTYIGHISMLLGSVISERYKATFLSSSNLHTFYFPHWSYDQSRPHLSKLTVGNVSRIWSRISAKQKKKRYWILKSIGLEDLWTLSYEWTFNRSVP